jgi:hypothetical protein
MVPTAFFVRNLKPLFYPCKSAPSPAADTTEGHQAMSEGCVYQRKDRRWCAKYKDANATWRYLYRKTKAEAKQALRAALKDKDDNIVAADKLTLNDALDHWLEGMRDSVSLRTWTNRESLVRIHIKPHVIGSKRLCRLSAEDLRGFIGRSCARSLRPASGVCTTLSTRRARTP